MPRDARLDQPRRDHGSEGVNSNLHPEKEAGHTAPGIGSVDQLARTIETVIIPGMLVRHGLAPGRAATKGLRLPDLDGLEPDTCAQVFAPHVQMLVDLLLDDEVDRAFELARHFLRQGLKRQDLMLYLLAPAANLLGTLWEDDRANFADVTIAVACLTKLLRDVRAGVVTDPCAGFFAPANQGLIFSAIGEDHTFGLQVCKELLRLHNWCVTCLPCAALAHISAAVEDSWFSFVGISSANALSADELHSWIKTLRTKSQNTDLKIYVGGPSCVLDPDFAEKVGADGGFASGMEAVRVVAALRNAAGEVVNSV